jgi:hypothetical protein
MGRIWGRMTSVVKGRTSSRDERTRRAFLKETTPLMCIP